MVLKTPRVFPWQFLFYFVYISVLELVADWGPNYLMLCIPNFVFKIIYFEIWAGIYSYIVIMLLSTLLYKIVNH